MKKKIFAIGLISALGTMTLTGCCEHKWKEATCTTAKTCTECDATQGEALGHDWEDATCTEPKTCSVCGETEGEALGHDWQDATCTEPQTCSRCDETQGEAVGHTADWTVTKEDACTEEGEETGKCTVCKKDATQKIAKLDHTPGEWVVTEEAGWNVKGTRTRSCTACGTSIETEEYELSDEEAENGFKASCQSFSYDQIARDSDTYFMDHATYTGEVVQVIEDDNGEMSYRINVTPTSWGGYTDTIYVSFYKGAVELMKTRMLEDDIVTLWGMNTGIVSYTTVMGAKVSIPSVAGEYIEVVG